MTQHQCRICGSEGDFVVTRASEQMFGSAEPFDYVQCPNCACLQIADIPSDLARHYPSNYYSQQVPDASGSRADSGWKAALKHAYSRSAVLSPGGIMGSTLRRFMPVPTEFAESGDYLARADLRNVEERILDVGCGASPHRLAAYRRWGFKQVEGVDPYIPQDLEFEGVPVRKAAIAEVSGTFGLIMFHHSLEHVPDPVADLQAAAKLLRPGGTCLVRIPVMDTYFWRRFGTHWVELDAPRHLHLMAPETVLHAARRANFEVRAPVYDSQAWEIAASIRHQQGHPLRTGLPGDPGPLSWFDADTCAEFKRQADDLNRLSVGGRASFYLVKPA